MVRFINSFVGVDLAHCCRSYRARKNPIQGPNDSELCMMQCLTACVLFCAITVVTCFVNK